MRHNGPEHFVFLRVPLGDTGADLPSLLQQDAEPIVAIVVGTGLPLTRSASVKPGLLSMCAMARLAAGEGLALEKAERHGCRVGLR